MQYLRWDSANIVGLSMGGGIAAAFTDQFPHLVAEAVGLIASAGLMEVRWSIYHPSISTLNSRRVVQRNFSDGQVHVFTSRANTSRKQTFPRTYISLLLLS
jgi:pimeloyl-ACP methyl ester carboxylesterase